MRIQLRTPEEVRLRPRKPLERKPYRFNEWPTLLRASYLVPSASAGNDDATRTFTQEQAVHLYLESFERSEYDPEPQDRRGASIEHGIRVCLFDPQGKRLDVQAFVPDAGAALAARHHLELSMPLKPGLGSYTVQACSVGPIEEALRQSGDPRGEDFSGAPCKRVILEYDFEVTAPAR